MSALVLIGARGCGKSSAGALAAEALALPFVDTDRLVERAAGREVHAIFHEQGEAGFRAREREVLREVLARLELAQVVATGGGCVLDASVRQQLARHRGVVWICAPLPLLQQRIRHSQRPSLTGDDPADELPRVLAQREPLYRQACSAGLRLETGHWPPARVAQQLAQHYTQLQLHAQRTGG